MRQLTMCAFHTERVLNCMLEPGKITRVYIMAIIVFFLSTSASLFFKRSINCYMFENYTNLSPINLVITRTFSKWNSRTQSAIGNIHAAKSNRILYFECCVPQKLSNFKSTFFPPFFSATSKIGFSTEMRLIEVKWFTIADQKRPKNSKKKKK